jgi:tripartite-type tricarboxylate transporter receptor subunit TctC
VIRQLRRTFHNVPIRNKEVNVALANPNLEAMFADLGGSVFPGSPSDFGKFIADETEKWGKVIQAANIKPE